MFLMYLLLFYKVVANGIILPGSQRHLIPARHFTPGQRIPARHFMPGLDIYNVWYKSSLMPGLILRVFSTCSIEGQISFDLQSYSGISYSYVLYLCLFIVLH